MMAQRGDFTVVHEPFSYLAEFGHADIGGSRVRSAPELLGALRALAARRPVFAKETTGKRLIRHPRETIASYHALNPLAPRDKIRSPAAVVAGYCAWAGSRSCRRR